MMTEKEMLELAAKAINLPLGTWNDGGEPYSSGQGFILQGNQLWNPATNDGDSRRLQVTLRIAVTPYPVYGQPKHSVIAKQYQRGDMMRESNPTEAIEVYGDDPAAATRLAVLKCAAKIGKAMP